MIRSFTSRATEDIANGIDSKAARKALPMELHRSAQRKLTIIESSRMLEEIATPPGNRLEALRGNRAGFHSIRINDQWRIVFRWDGSDAHDVEICDYH